MHIASPLPPPTRRKVVQLLELLEAGTITYLECEQLLGHLALAVACGGPIGSRWRIKRHAARLTELGVTDITPIESQAVELGSQLKAGLLTDEEAAIRMGRFALAEAAVERAGGAG